MNKKYYFQISFLLLLQCFTASLQAASPVQPGLEVLCSSHAEKLAGKRVAILTNPTGIDLAGVSTIDRIRALPEVKVVRLFAPEHGLRGGFQAGENVDDSRDPVSGLPIVSLHGSTRRPPPESLKDLDLVIYDIQDIGSRSYTFVSSLTYLMEACEKAGVAVWVLDRPDPMGGNKIGGPMLDDDLKSFIGVHNVPQTYGLTPGEWAQLIKSERTPDLNLTIIPMAGWKRGMLYGELNWPWVPPSEHIPRWEASFFYAMTGTLGELGVVSEGVGTPLPFEQIGAPWIDAQKLSLELNNKKIPGVWFRPTTFKPRYGTHSGKFCNGVQIHLTDAHSCNPADISTTILFALQSLYPGRKLFESRSGSQYQMFERALGSRALARRLAAGDAAERSRVTTEIPPYLSRRSGVLLYE